MAQLKITPPKKAGNTPINIQIINGINDETASITIKAPDGGVATPPPLTLNYAFHENDPAGSPPVGLYTYSRDTWPIGTYTVTIRLSNSLPNTLTGSFQVLSASDFAIPSITYPTTIRQMDSFTWIADNAKPGESLTYTETGPVTIVRSGIAMEANYDYDPPVGIISKISFFEYAGDYTVTFNFSRSPSVTKIIKVTPKIYVIYPSKVIATEPFTYSISGGNPNETWTAEIDGPTPSSISGTLDADGKASYTNAVIGSSGFYNITFTFAKSGKFKQDVLAEPSARSGTHPAGTALFYSEINAEFLNGYDLDQYRNYRWYLSLDNPSWDLNLGIGNFSDKNLNFYQFYDKRAIDPVVPGQKYYGSPGSYEFTVPANRNGINVEGWGAGGGTEGGPSGEATNISAENYYMVAGGGGTAGGGGRRYGAPPAGGGVASGGTVNINGEGGYWSSAYSNSGKGGDSPFGGAGGAPRGVNQGSNPGNAPGGGSSGNSGRDYSKDPAFGFSSGGGGGAYVSSKFNLKRGKLITFNVGNGYSGGAPGAVRLTWS